MKCAFCGEETDKSTARYCSVCGTVVCHKCAEKQGLCNLDQGDYLYYN